jgi:2-polyprenyl-6-hydroxyphenyl methylase/3-demethylubiquinone-9 3-methyltransferase
MDANLQAICAKQAECKCCGATAFLCGVVDFHKNCESHKRKVLDVAGVPIYYHRCPECRFIFTTAFDHFTKEDFRRHIYNDDYVLVDPEYQQVRPKVNAELVSSLFPHARPTRILDYGGGEGRLAELLHPAGFPHVDTYDPFVPRHADKPAGRYDCVISFEVLEHSTDPARTLADMIDSVTDPGLILFSTLLQPADIEYIGLHWWYAAPRNGHVSLYSQASLERLVQPFGFGLGSFNDNLHVLIREVPDFARHLVRPSPAIDRELYTSTILVS